MANEGGGDGGSGSGDRALFGGAEIADVVNECVEFENGAGDRGGGSGGGGGGRGGATVFLVLFTSSPYDKGNKTVAGFRGGGGGGGGSAGVGFDLVTGVTKGLESKVRGTTGKATGKYAFVLLDSFCMDNKEAGDNAVTLEVVELSGSNFSIIS